MVSKRWTICSFLFTYKKIEYIVLVKRFVGKEKRVDNYALVKLHFMKSKDLEDDLQVEANSAKLIADEIKLRKYFQVTRTNNLGNFLWQLTSQLGECIPKKVPDKISDIQRTAMVRSLSRSDSEDPHKIYCNKIKRNPNGAQRSEFNADKTKLLRPSLFMYFHNDPSISFCYYSDPAMENNDATILRNFSKQLN